jgi:hypothetical protein
MAEPAITTEALTRALAGLDLDLPATPSIAPAVRARLETDRAARARPPFPRTALWSRRRVLVFAAIGVLGLLALALGARFVIGAAEIRVQPEATPSGPPLGPDTLGEPVPLEALDEAVGFPVALPAGPPPDEAHLVFVDRGDAALLAWDASPRYPALPGTPWGLVLLEIRADDEVVVKDVNAFEDLRDVRVDGRRAAWIPAPHGLTVLTPTGSATYSVEGNVLIWTRGDVTYRLETSLPRAAAIALAETVA